MIFLKFLWPILLFNFILSYLIALIRSHNPFLIFFSEHTLRRRQTASVLEDDHRRTTHNKEQEKNGYLQVLWFPHPRSLDGPRPQLLLLSGPLFTLCSQANIGYNTCCQINSTRLSLPNFRIHGVHMGNRSLELWRRWAAGERTLVDTRASQNWRTMWMSGTRTDCNAKVLSGRQIKAVVCRAARKRR